MAVSYRPRRSLTLLPSADAGDFKTLLKEIRPEWIDEALQVTGTASVRRRRLPAELVLGLVLGMALFRKLPIAEIVDRLDLVLPGTGPARVARSGVAQARQRLGAAPMRYLFKKCSDHWGHRSARQHAWRDLAVYGVDGTRLRVPDSPENRAYFGGHAAGGERGQSGYPLMCVVVLMALRSHIIVDAAGGPYATPEQGYAEGLWHQVPENSLVIVDRGFLDSKILVPLQNDETNRHWLTRAKKNMAFSTVTKWSASDRLVELQISRSARQLDPSLPQQWLVRAINYTRRGFRPQTLITSLLDRDKYPAREIVSLYHERWELELGFDEVKTEVLDRQEALRSKSPDGVMQELWGVAVAYNLVRLEIERVAAQLNLPPMRISFVMALRTMREMWLWIASLESPGTIPKNLRWLQDDLTRFVLPPRRTRRRAPRAVKLKMSSYPRKRPTEIAK